MSVKVVEARGEAPLPVEVIERSIVELAEGMRKINATRLTRKTVIALLHDNSKVPKREIEIILNNLADLERIFLKPKANKS